jgi:hypothetical protein
MKIVPLVEEELQLRVYKWGEATPLGNGRLLLCFHWN